MHFASERFIVDTQETSEDPASSASRPEGQEDALKPIFPKHFRVSAPRKAQEAPAEIVLDLSEATWASLLTKLRSCLEDPQNDKKMQASSQGHITLTIQAKGKL